MGQTARRVSTFLLRLQAALAQLAIFFEGEVPSSLGAMLRAQSSTMLSSSTFCWPPGVASEDLLASSGQDEPVAIGILAGQPVFCGSADDLACLHRVAVGEERTVLAADPIGSAL